MTADRRPLIALAALVMATAALYLLDLSATNGSQSAAAPEVSSGTPVMAIGGWSGDPVLTPGKGHGDVIFGHSRSAAHTREIAEWVANHYQGTVIGGSTVYRLT
jgi:hypothetical protein